MRIVSYQKMVWRSDENYGLQHCLFSCEKSRYWLIILGFSCEMFWFFIWFTSCKHLKSNNIVSVVICLKKAVISVNISKNNQNYIKFVEIWSQFYATCRTFLQFRFERYFKYLQWFLRSVSYQKMAWRSDEKYGFTALLI